VRIDNNELLFADAFIRDKIDLLYDWSIGDIRKCAGLKSDGAFKKNGPFVGVFILWCCAIDFWGGIFSNNSISKCRFVSFIDSYLSVYGKYDYEILYNLRNKLVHNYTPESVILETEEDKESLHLAEWNNKLVLHLKPCIYDLESAAKDLVDDLKNNNERKIVAWRYFKKHPPVKSLEF